MSEEVVKSLIPIKNFFGTSSDTPTEKALERVSVLPTQLIPSLVLIPFWDGAIFARTAQDPESLSHVVSRADKEKPRRSGARFRTWVRMWSYIPP